MGIQCGTDWIENAIASKLEEIVNDAQRKYHIVEVTTTSHLTYSKEIVKLKEVLIIDK